MLVQLQQLVSRAGYDGVVEYLDEDGDEVARRTWCGVAYDADECGEENPIEFGDYGYYTDWVGM